MEVTTRLMEEPAAGLLLLSVLVSEAAESPYSVIIPILKDDRTQDAYDGYSFDFESGNGIVRMEYESPEGVPVEISFVADQGGYQPQGAIIPVAPPLPYQRSGN
ncbi:larval cuticle protein LCP-17-like [Penaeus vannamei]|uniref:larval cuticle protein LCP-17-like n=1 Tax=Penaeus vannamei TaxID=6689 RepID=UPI00387F8BCA